MHFAGYHVHIALLLLSTLLVASCGEPYRAEAQQYLQAVRSAIALSETKPSQGRLFWNDCGKEVTCLYLYETSDDTTIENAVTALLRAKNSVGHPGVKLTVLSSAHGEARTVIREVTIK